MKHSSPSAASGKLERLLGFLQQDPDNAALRSDVFDCALSAGQADIAEQQVSRMLARQPLDAGWRHRLATLRIAQQRYGEARRLLEELIGEGHGAAAILYNLAYAAYRDNAFEVALQTLERLPDQGRAFAPAFGLRLRCMHHLGAIDEAIALFRSTLSRGDAVAADAFGAASLLAIDAGLISEAQAWSARALAEDEMQFDALVARGSALLARQDAEAAAACLDRALQRNPVDGRAWSARATASMLRMELPQALQQYEKALGYMPGHIGTWHGLAWCRLLLQDLAGARLAFEHALALDRNFSETHGGLAVVAALEGRADEARACAERACKLDPANVSARYAEALLSGDAADAARLRRLAERIMGGRTLDGRALSDIILGKRR